MKSSRSVLLFAFLSLAAALLLTGCMANVYTPTAGDAPQMSAEEARGKVMSLTGRSIYVNKTEYRIKEIKIQPESVEFTSFRAFLGIETSRNVKTLRFKDLVGVTNQMTYFLSFTDQTFINIGLDRDEAVSIAQAFYVLGKISGDKPASGAPSHAYTPKVDPAAEAAFPEIARMYREAQVKPELPEEARRYAVQGDFAVEKKNPVAAIDRYSDALKVAPWWPEGHLKRGRILAEIDQYNEAIAEMKKFLQLAPDTKEAREAQDNIYKWESAGTLSPPKTPSEQAGQGQADEADILTGVITGGNFAKGIGFSNPNVRLMVTSDNGEETMIYVRSDSKVFETGGNQIDYLETMRGKGRKVKIKYFIIKDGTGGDPNRSDFAYQIGHKGVVWLRFLN